MKINKIGPALLLLLLAGQAFAADSKQQWIDARLEILANGDESARIEMLQGLQWAGLSDPLLFDPIAQWPASDYQNDALTSPQVNLMSYQIRALGYSGNPVYRDLLEKIQADAGNKKLKRHARNALKDLGIYQRWNQEVAQSDFSASGESYEVETYMKMVNSDDPGLQRMAARAVFHERQDDPELLEMIAARLSASYRLDGLDGETQDTMAWYCKALGQNAIDQYNDLLTQVKDNTPYKKIKKWASKYAR